MSNKKLVDKLLKASQKIHKSSLSGSGNYATINETISDIIYKIDRRRIRKNKIKSIFNV